MPRIVKKHCRFAMKSSASEIDRWGIFADEPIPARRRVIEYKGQKIDAKEMMRRRVRQNLYLFLLKKGFGIDGAIGGSGAEYINHSCSPNLYARVARGHIWLVSLRRIETGAELLLDYRISGDYPLVECRCGSAECRGYLNWPG